MIEIELPLSLEEVRHRRSYSHEPLEILRLLNLCPPGNWKFIYAFSVDEAAILSIVPPATIPPRELVSFAPIGLFDYSILRIMHDGGWFECNWIDALDCDAKSNRLIFKPIGMRPGPAQLELAGCHGGALPHQMADDRTVRRFLMSQTWVGSRALPPNRYSIQVNHLALTVHVANQPQIEEDLGPLESAGNPGFFYESVIGSPPTGTLFFRTTWGFGQSRVRFTESGLLSDDELRHIFGPDGSRLMPSGEIEIRFPLRELAPDGTLLKTEQVEALVAGALRILAGLHQHAGFAGFLTAGKKLELERQAKRIDLRKQSLMRARFLYWKGRFVYRVPSNENEVVAFHQKLEGMGGVPLDVFESLEYTPKLGIDALANFRLSPDSPIQKLATVEFEYDFRSFFAHQHPFGHTDLIICWTAPDSMVDYEYTVDNTKTWLRFIRLDNRIVPVLCASHYPSLSMRKLEDTQ